MQQQENGSSLFEDTTSFELNEALQSLEGDQLKRDGGGDDCYRVRKMGRRVGTPLIEIKTDVGGVLTHSMSAHLVRAAPIVCSMSTT